MFSLKTSIVAALLALTASAKDYPIDPESVPLAVRRSWCVDQIATCTLLCLQNKDNGTVAIGNDCDAETLEYECLCSNNLSPNVSEYSQTLPYFTCVEYVEQCVKNCDQANTLCQSNCRTDNLCGAQNPKLYNITTTSSSVASPTGASGNTDGVVYNGFDATPSSGSSTQESGKTGGAQMALDLGRSYGLAVVFTGIFAGFALIM